MADDRERRASARRVARLQTGQTDLFVTNIPVVQAGATFHRDARLSDPETSWEPARRTTVHRSRLRHDVFQALHAAGANGMTDSELAATFPDDHPGSVSKRRHDLVVDMVVRDSGLTRKNTYGSTVTVWVVV